jgi:hypothetical protein
MEFTVDKNLPHHRMMRATPLLWLWGRLGQSAQSDEEHFCFSKTDLLLLIVYKSFFRFLLVASYTLSRGRLTMPPADFSCLVLPPCRTGARNTLLRSEIQLILKTVFLAGREDHLHSKF